MMENEELSRFDGLFTTIADRLKGIEPLLDTFFSFLERKTNFFSPVINCDKNDPPSMDKCKDMILKYYEKHRENAEKRLKGKLKESKRLEEEKARKLEESLKKEEYFKLQKELAEGPRIQEIFDDDTDDSCKNASTPHSNLDDNISNSHSSNLGHEDSDSDHSEPPRGNGGKTDKYTWTQTLSCVDVIIKIPPSTRAKDCEITFGTKRLKVHIKGHGTIIDGELLDKVKPDDCIWSLDDSANICLTLEKLDGMRWWKCVIIGDPEIDTKKIIPENSKLSDLDSETRATVEKMIFEQRQKAAGLPTPEQKKQNDILNKFKEAHPELDFSNAKINWGNNSMGNMQI